MLKFSFFNNKYIRAVNMKKYFLAILLIWSSAIHGETPSTAASNKSPIQMALAKEKILHYPPSLAKAVKAIESLPDAAELIAEVQAAGLIKIEAQFFYDSDFEALWDSESRIIYVNESNNTTVGKQIASILFELHNAKTNNSLRRLFQQAKTGQIDKNSYVESIERMEHKNAVSTSQMIEKGLALSLFPQDARWSVFSNFDDHYKIQQIYGHSQWIANKFDILCPPFRRIAYSGTIRGLSSMSSKEKNAIVRLLVLKNQIDSEDIGDSQKVDQLIREEFGKAELSKGTETELLELVFASEH